MAPVEPADTLRVVVAYSPRAGQVDEVALSLAVGATVANAVQASGLMQRHPTLELASLRVGIWGKLRQPADGLRQGDRVEIYRPLSVDPKEARRLRYRQHRERYATK
jgi:uncharacterized protein